MKYYKYKFYFIPLLYLFGMISLTSFSPKTADDFSGKVVGIKDGDTYVILSNTIQCVIRLAHIDCPEKSQPFGSAAKKFASDRCFGKEVLVIGDGTRDRNKRIIAEIFIKDTCINKEIVKAGYAWHFKKYSKSDEYNLLELNARSSKIGLWSDDNPIAPWDWRKSKH